VPRERTARHQKNGADLDVGQQQGEMVLCGQLRVVFAERDVVEDAALRQANVDVRAGGGGKELRWRHADHVLAVLR